MARDAIIYKTVYVTRGCCEKGAGAGRPPKIRLTDRRSATNGKTTGAPNGNFREETLRYPEIGVRVTGSAMFFPFCGDVIDLTR